MLVLRVIKGGNHLCYHIPSCERSLVIFKRKNIGSERRSENDLETHSNRKNIVTLRQRKPSPTPSERDLGDGYLTRIILLYQMLIFCDVRVVLV